MDITIILAASLVTLLGLVATLGGADSRDGFESDTRITR